MKEGLEVGIFTFILIIVLGGGVTKCTYDGILIEVKSNCYEKTKREECFK